MELECSSSILKSTGKCKGLQVVKGWKLMDELNWLLDLDQELMQGNVEVSATQTPRPGRLSALFSRCSL